MKAYLWTASACAFALLAHAGCSGASVDGITGTSCSLDPICYVVSTSGECSVDTNAICSNGVWTCSASGVLGSGCLSDGGIAPVTKDAGKDGDAACVLATLSPPLSCTDDSTCIPYGGHCAFDSLNGGGAGECECGSSACSGSVTCFEVGEQGCYGAPSPATCTASNWQCSGGTTPSTLCYEMGTCTLGAIDISCSDDTPCAPYNASCGGNGYCGCVPLGGPAD